MSHLVEVKVDLHADDQVGDVSSEVVNALRKLNLNRFGIFPQGNDLGTVFEPNMQSFVASFEMRTGSYAKGLEIARAALCIAMNRVLDAGAIVSFTTSEHTSEYEYALGI